MIHPPSYPRVYDYKNFCSHRCCWICRHLYFASAVADSGRIAFSCKASRRQKNARGSLARWGCCIAFSGGLTCRFTESEPRSQTSRDCDSKSSRVTRSFARGKTRSHKGRRGSSGKSFGITR